MQRRKGRAVLLRIATVPVTLKVLLKGQLEFMQQYFDEIHTISSEGIELKSIASHGIKTHVVAMKRKPAPFSDLKSLFLMYKLIIKLKPSIVHTHTPKAGFLGMLASKMAGVEHRLHTVAGIPWMESSGWRKEILKMVEKWTYQLSTEVYFNSDKLMQFVISQHLLNPSNAKVIGKGSSNGIDTHYFKRNAKLVQKASTLRNNWGWKPENFTYLFVGRLVSDKGINELVQAFFNLNKENPKLKLLLVGPYEDDRDPVNPETKEIINTNTDILTTGFVEDVRPYMLASHALIFPSYREGFPNVPMQAGALELPSIVTDINGCNEIVEHKKNGLIIPIKDIKALYYAMKNLYQNKKLYKSLKSQARESITSRFQQELIWHILLKEYKQMLNA